MATTNNDILKMSLVLKTDLAKAIAPVMVTNLELLDRKQQDYGSRNLTEFGTMGVVVRMSDKMERIKNLIKKRDARSEVDADKLPPSAPLNESIADSFLDLANYAYIAYVMHTKKWPHAIPVGPAIDNVSGAKLPSYPRHGDTE
jgi:hypothetical protein